MEKKELLRETANLMRELSDKITEAGVASSFAEGTYHHPIAHSLDIPSSFAAGYFRDICRSVDDPEAEKEYSRLRPFKRARAAAARRKMESILSGIPEDALQEAHDNAKAALDSGIEESVAYFAHALSTKAGQDMNEEDKKGMGPVMRAYAALNAYSKIQDALQQGNGE